MNATANFVVCAFIHRFFEIFIYLVRLFVHFALLFSLSSSSFASSFVVVVAATVVVRGVVMNARIRIITAAHTRLQPLLRLFIIFFFLFILRIGAPYVCILEWLQWHLQMLENHWNVLGKLKCFFLVLELMFIRAFVVCCSSSERERLNICLSAFQCTLRSSIGCVSVGVADERRQLPFSCHSRYSHQ